ncbi:MAG: 2-C-methyl-D-erythritol 4-phosphate cytidylyltransferase [Candidatus Omnitrophota bacterium]
MRKIPYITAIIPAAGSGSRLGARVSKPLVEIGNKPLLAHTIRALSVNPLIRNIIIAANLSNTALIGSIVKRSRFKKVAGIVLGGATRRLSVENGLKEVPGRAEYILIHDAVRPFADQALINRVIEAAIESGAAVAGVPVKGTVKRSRPFRMPVTHKNILVVKETLSRDNLWEIQTPQVFRKSLILKAYERNKDAFVTDDAMLLEKAGVKVSLVQGSYFNIKITTPEDLILAQAILEAQKNKNK